MPKNYILTQPLFFAHNAGIKQGHSLILETGYSNILGKRFTKGLWNSYKFEIAGCETGSSNNILQGLKHCASKRETEVAVIVYPKTPFDKDVFDRTIRRYKGLEKLKDGQYIKFKRIICIHGEEIVLLSKHGIIKKYKARIIWLYGTRGKSLKRFSTPSHCKYTTNFKYITIWKRNKIFKTNFISLLIEI